jgi:uncharacterized protein (TIGR02145 family)
LRWNNYSNNIAETPPQKTQAAQTEEAEEMEAEIRNYSHSERWNFNFIIQRYFSCSLTNNFFRGEVFFMGSGMWFGRVGAGNRRAILKAVGIAAVAVVFCAGCSETPPDDDTGGYTGSYDSVEYGGKTYKTVKIGSQTWFAENLDYAVGGSVCYENSPSNCAKYGRLYNWDDAKTACPSGWHLSSNAEWITLAAFVGGEVTAGKKLKSTSGWNDNGNGTNQYGFSALPGGIGYSGDYFNSAGNNGYWWSATEYDASNAWGRNMCSSFESVSRGYGNDNKTYLFSVRCVQD